MDITALATKRLAWRNSLSDEDKAKLVAEKQSWEAEETKAERMAEFSATFTTNDTNADGVLDRAEFENFLVALGQNAANRQVPHQDNAEYSAEEKDGIYAIFNAKSEGEGVSQADFFAVMLEIGAKVHEIEGQ